MEKGDTYKFIGQPYRDGNGYLQIGDEVIIHPVFGISQATKSYPAKIVEKEVKWTSGTKAELWLQGTGRNKNWYGAVLNQYGFNRLEKAKPSKLKKILGIK